MSNIRIGFGYDFHKLIDGEHMYLGGYKINANYSIDAHSDGDVVLHALADAIYGALASGDIGVHFPSNDSNKNIASSKIIKHAINLLSENMYSINNIDITIILEKPYLKDEIVKIRESLSNLISVDINQISIKSSTSQKIGLIGNNQAIACYVSILVEK